MHDFWAHAAAFVWGKYTVVLLMGTGIYLSCRLRFKHLRNFKLAWKFAAQGTAAPPDASTLGEISPWQSMMTMLAGAIGNGNIAGVATAIATGGPGAIFWMWASGLLAMATKYSEAILGFQYREQLEDGSVAGGPMYYLNKGVRSPLLAWIFAFLAGMAAMTTGPLAQTNSMALVLNTEFHIPKWVSGLGIAVGAWLVVIGGLRSIARLAEKLVPLKIFLYVGGSLYIILANFRVIPETVRLIFAHAFTPAAALGGFAGASVLLAARLGAARGLYANEAGLGTAGMAYGAAKSKDPIRQGLIATVDVFVITFVTCTMTALVVTVTGKWSSGLTSTALVAAAFNSKIPLVGGWIVAVSSFLFGYSNLVGWSYYGEVCFRYIFSKRIVKIYAWIYCGLILVGAIAEVRTVWDYADTMNGLQIFPNLLAVILLAPQVTTLTRNYFQRPQQDPTNAAETRKSQRF
jgi:AGCS family alanine or glycine:cation symporter